MEVIYALFETRQILGYLIYGMLHKLDCTAEGGREMPKLGSKKEETHKKAEEQENCDSVQRLISLNLLPPQPGAAAPR